MSNHGVTQYRVNPTDSESFYNLVEQYNLECISKNAVGLIGSIIFIGWAVGCILIPPYADKNGRRTPFLLACLLQMIVWSMLIFASNIYELYALCFVFGFCIAGRFTVGYILLVESMPKAYRV